MKEGQYSVLKSTNEVLPLLRSMSSEKKHSKMRKRSSEIRHRHAQNDISQRVQAKTFLSDKRSLKFNFFSFLLQNSFTDQSEVVFVWHIATFQRHDVIINRPK